MYQITTNPDTILRISDGATIPRGHRWWSEYEAWLADGNVPESPPQPSIDDRKAALEQAVQAHMDAAARARRWDSIYTAAMRAGWPGPYQDEGRAFAQWMDACWQVALDTMNRVLAGKMPEPTAAELVAMLPSAPVFDEAQA